jgi:hypothetical protein
MASDGNIALNFDEVIVDSAFALINYHLVEISSLYNLSKSSFKLSKIDDDVCAWLMSCGMHPIFTLYLLCIKSFDCKTVRSWTTMFLAHGTNTLTWFYFLANFA